jgi:hypothetical protein
MIDTLPQANICTHHDSMSYDVGRRNPWENYHDDRMSIQNEILFFVVLAGALCFMLLGVLDAVNQTNKHK